jgi:transposase
VVRPYSNDFRERVVAAMQAGESCRFVAWRFAVAPSSVVKWTQRAAATGSVAPGKMGGHRKPILEAHRDSLLDLVRARPESTAKGLPAARAAQRGILVSHDTVWRFLRAAVFSF